MNKEQLEEQVKMMLEEMSINKDSVISFLNEYSFTRKEICCIYDFIFYLYTGDYHLFKQVWKNWLESSEKY